MSKTKTYTESPRIEIKSKFDAEFRRWSFKRHDEPQNFERFSGVIEDQHRLANIQFNILYVDPCDNYLLPINNDDNFGRALKTAKPLLRIIVQRKDDSMECPGFGAMKPRCNNIISSILGQTPVKTKAPTISIPHDFRQVSAIIDVDIVPATQRRVRQRTLTTPRRSSFSRSSQQSYGFSHHTNTSDENEPDDTDEIVDLTGVSLGGHAAHAHNVPPHHQNEASSLSTVVLSDSNGSKVTTTVSQ